MHPFFKPKRALTASPEATPYQRAGQVWDDRMGLSIAHARNWRRIALANLALAAFLGAGWWVQADRAVVRPFVNDTALIKRHLDMGAQTLLLPMINSRAEAEGGVGQVGARRADRVAQIHHRAGHERDPSHGGDAQ